MSYPQDQPSAIEIKAGFFILAFVWFLFPPRYSVDGGPEQRTKWGSTLVPVAPGQHQVSVWAPYLFLSKCGLNTMVVPVPPGQVTRVSWNAPFIVFMKGSMRSEPAGALPAGAGYAAVGPPAEARQVAEAVGGTTTGWYPDPSGRYEQRYFDGQAWTSHVTRGGATAEDPI